MEHKMLNTKAPSLRATQKRVGIAQTRVLVAKARDLATGIKALKSGRTLSAATRVQLNSMSDTLGNLVAQILALLSATDNLGDEADPSSDNGGMD
jgi:hypothetical protein